MVEDLIRQARRRFMFNEALAQSAFAVAVFAAGVILLLLIGTRYLSAWSIAVFGAAGVGVGIYQLRRKMPTDYATAVRLDETAHLHDALSTALHFSRTGVVTAPDAAFLKMQREQAEAAARTVNVPVVLPFTMPRAVYAMAALGIAASILIGLRYRVGHGLDLQRPITEVLFEDQNGARPKPLAKARNAQSGDWSEEARDMLSKLGIKPEFDDSADGEPDPLNKAIEQALQQDTQNKMDQKGSGQQKGGEKGDKGAQKGDDPNGNSPVDGDKGDDQKGGGQKNAKNGDDSQNSPGKNGENKDGLMSKLKNALSDMLSKTPQPQGDANKQQSDQKSQSDKKEQAKKENGPGQGTPEKGSGDQDSDETDPNGDPMGGQKGKSNDKTASNTPQQQEGSGIGLADGKKDVQAAEQLKAMGKISEIIGKRAAEVSGETMVEVQSGKQQLKTSYTNSRATHAETDGDVTRDEIPLALQPYVQQYFSAVHKAEPGAEGKAGAKGKAAR